MKRHIVIRDTKTNEIYYAGVLLLENSSLLELYNRIFLAVEQLPACIIHCGWLRDDSNKLIEKTNPIFDYDTVHLLLTNEKEYLDDLR